MHKINKNEEQLIEQVVASGYKIVEAKEGGNSYGNKP